MRSIAIVGGSLAGLSTARALRARGYDGELTVVEGETHAAYDRPPLSKAFLHGDLDVADLALAADDEQLEINWRRGVAARALHPGRGGVELSDGSELLVDGVVVASGARPRQPFPAPAAGVHTLRTLDDAVGLRSALVPSVRLVVVGAGFIGAEVAATASALGVDVTVVEATPAPMAGPFGAQLGHAVAGLHADHGVRLVVDAPVRAVLGAATVDGVELADGRVLSADVVLVGVGVRPNVEWLAGSGVAADALGVRCDAFGATDIPSVVAVGDCSAWYDADLGEQVRLEHWTAARERGAVAAATLLSAGTLRMATRPPYVWSDQYGFRIQLAGHPRASDSVRVEHGSLEARDVLAVYRRGETPVAVLAMGRGTSDTTRLFATWRKRLAADAVARRATALTDATRST